MGGAEHSRQGGEAWGRPKHHAQDLVQTLQNGGLSFLPAQPLSSLDGTVLATFICGLRPVSLHPECPARRKGTWPVLLIPAFPEPKGLCVSGTHWGLSKYQWQELTERNPLHLTLKLGPRCSPPPRVSQWQLYARTHIFPLCCDPELLSRGRFVKG